MSLPHFSRVFWAYLTDYKSRCYVDFREVYANKNTCQHTQNLKKRTNKTLWRSTALFGRTLSRARNFQVQKILQRSNNKQGRYLQTHFPHSVTRQRISTAACVLVSVRGLNLCHKNRISFRRTPLLLRKCTSQKQNLCRLWQGNCRYILPIPSIICSISFLTVELK